MPVGAWFQAGRITFRANPLDISSSQVLGKIPLRLWPVCIAFGLLAWAGPCAGESSAAQAPFPPPFTGHALAGLATAKISTPAPLRHVSIFGALGRFALPFSSLPPFVSKLDTPVPLNPPEALAGVAVLALSWVGLLRRRMNLQSQRTETPRESALERRYRELADHANDMIYRHDLAGNFQSVNPAGERLLGYAGAEWVGLNLTQIMEPEQLAKAKQHMQEKVAGDQGTTYELEVRHKDGRRLTLEISSWLVLEDGQPVAVDGIARDVTERKATEAALKASEDLNRTLLSSLPQRIFFKDRQSIFRRVNEPFARDLGLAPYQVEGKSDFDFFPAELAQKYRGDDQRVMASRQPVSLEEINVIQGNERMVEVVKAPVIDDRGELIGLLGLFTDITERKQAERELEALNKRLMDASRHAGMAEVATGVLHNVGNVLNSVNVSATLLTERLRHSEIANLAKVSQLLTEHRADLAEYLTRDGKGKLIPAFLGALAEQLSEERAAQLQELTSLQQNIDHVKDIVATQQNYAKMSGIVETLPVMPLVEDALRMNVGALARHKVRVVREYEEVPMISVEKHKVLQILINLIRNAKYALDEHSEPDKRLTLRIRRQGEAHVRIEVADNGIGIGPEDLTRVFSHGFTTRKDGHGFGLHSGALAAKEMGGSLTGHSLGRGQGATFILELPLSREPGTGHEQ